MSNKFNKKPHFTLIYGDDIGNDGKRMSAYVVNKFKDKNFENHLRAVAFTAFTLGSFAGPSNAILPEYGEAASNVLKDIPLLLRGTIKRKLVAVKIKKAFIKK